MEVEKDRRPNLVWFRAGPSEIRDGRLEEPGEEVTLVFFVRIPSTIILHDADIPAAQRPRSAAARRHRKDRTRITVRWIWMLGLPNNFKVAIDKPQGHPSSRL